MGTRTLLAIAAAIALSIAPARAQALGEVRVTAQLSTGVAKPGERVVLTVVAENTLEAQIQGAPRVDGLQISPFGKPSSEEYYEIRAGGNSRTAKLSWSAAVVGAATGDFTIPPIDVKVGQRTLQTAPLQLTIVADVKGEEFGFLEVVPSSKRVIEGQPFSIEVRFGVDSRKSQYNFANLKLPWWNQLPGTIDVQTPSAASAAQTILTFIDGQQFQGVEELPPVQLRGATFRAWRIVRTFTPTRQGKLEFPTGFLEFGKLAMRESFFNKSYEKVESYFARAEGFSIDVVPLPEEGRPVDFGGAIGKLAVKASAEPRDVDAGESIKFKVEWTGAGNLEFFDPPDPSRDAAFAGFRVYGKENQTKSFERRVVVYDLAPTSPEVTEIPPLQTPVYDTEANRYVSIATAPIPIRVRSLKGANPLAQADGEAKAGAGDLVDIDARATPTRALPAPPPALVIGGLMAAPILGLVLRSVVRRRGDPATPAERRRRRARRELERALARAGDARAQHEALCEFLAARTREPREAWIGRDLRPVRVNGAVSRLAPDVHRELQATLAELEGDAWSGKGRTQDRARLLALADRLLGGGL